MRWWINIILLLIIAILIIPTIIVGTFTVPEEESREPVPVKKQQKSIKVEIAYDEPAIVLYDHYNKKMVHMGLEEYIAGVVAAEMPASFELEALKAQSIAARTLAAYKLRTVGGKGCSKYQGADVCSEFAHCQAWISQEQREKNWGDDYQKNSQKIERAIKETQGEIITFKGKPIEVFFYSTSNGKTEKVQEVFSAALPYYDVVESPGEEDAPRYRATVSFTIDEFIKKLKSRYNKSNVTRENIKNQIRIASYTDSGRVRELIIGGVTIKGKDFRYLYGLNSTDFRFRFEGQQIFIDTIGYGHGVGMSQIGANKMAQRGNNYQEILLHYYQGVSIEKIR